MTRKLSGPAEWACALFALPPHAPPSHATASPHLISSRVVFARAAEPAQKIARKMDASLSLKIKMYAAQRPLSPA